MREQFPQWIPLRWSSWSASRRGDMTPIGDGFRAANPQYGVCKVLGRQQADWFFSELLVYLCMQGAC
jgi:hypothetical protein